MKYGARHEDHIDLKVADFEKAGVIVPYDKFGPGVEATVKGLILDAIFSMIAGYRAIPEEEMKGLYGLMKQEPQICRPVFPVGAQTSCEMAGFLNGYAIRYADLCDSKRQEIGRGGHPADMIAGMLSICDQPGVDGKHILEAVNAGYKLWSILCHTMFYKRSELDPVTLLAIVVPLVLGICRGDSLEQIENAIRVSAVGAPVMVQIRAAKMITNMKCGATGYALHRAIWCDRMSSVLQCPDSIFTGFKGWAVMVAPFDKEMADAAEDDDEVYNLIQLKAAPCCNVNQGATESAVRIHEKIGDRLGDIKAIRIRVCEKDAPIAMKEGQPKYPINHPTADHHIQYCVAIGLKYGTLTPRHYEKEYLENEEIKNLIDLTDLGLMSAEEHVGLGGLPGAGVLEVELNDGTVLMDGNPCPSGLFIGLKPEERVEKMNKTLAFKQNMLKSAYGYDLTEVVDLVNHIENYDGKSLIDVLHKVLKVCET